MPGLSSQGSAFNRSRQVPLATGLAVADTHWTRLVGLLGLRAGEFVSGCGLWIVPCHGVHTLGMRFPIDAIYLDRDLTVIHVQSDLRPWRVAPVRGEAASVLELPCHTAVETGTSIGDKIEITVRQELVRPRSKHSSKHTTAGGVSN